MGIDKLNSHVLDCPDKSAMTQFQLTSSGCSGKGKEMRYQYTCCASTGAFGKDSVQVSNCGEARDKKLEYLIGHKLECPKDYYMNKWTFKECKKTKDKSDWQFEGVCNSFAKVAAAPTSAPTPVPTTGKPTKAPKTEKPTEAGCAKYKKKEKCKEQSICSWDGKAKVNCTEKQPTPEPTQKPTSPSGVGYAKTFK